MFETEKHLSARREEDLRRIREDLSIIQGIMDILGRILESAEEFADSQEDTIHETPI